MSYVRTVRAVFEVAEFKGTSINIPLKIPSMILYGIRSPGYPDEFQRGYHNLILIYQPLTSLLLPQLSNRPIIMLHAHAASKISKVQFEVGNVETRQTEFRLEQLPSHLYYYNS